MIYFIAAKGTPYVKIGRTAGDVKKRLAMLAVGCPFELRVIRVVAARGNEVSVERALHRKLKKFHRRGEWFALDSLQVESAVAEIEGGKICGHYKTFPSYLRDQLKRRGPIGDLARDSFNCGDGENPQMKKFTEWRQYLQRFGACDAAYHALIKAWMEYRRMRNTRSS